MMSMTWRRFALVLIVLTTVPVGMWALGSPERFYQSFPGWGRGWVALDGPYNEHLLRDFGSLNLALGFVAIMALATSSTTLARTAGGAVVVFATPHLIYHLFNLEPYNTAETIGVVLGLVISLAAGLLAVRPGPRRAT